MFFRRWGRAWLGAVLFELRFRSLVFVVARLEAPLLAAALYFVQINVLNDSSIGRFLLSWLGVIVLKWTLRCILDIGEGAIHERPANGLVPYFDFFAGQSRLAVNTLDFIVDVLIFLSALILLFGFERASPVMAWAFFVMATQAALHSMMYALYPLLRRYGVEFRKLLIVVFIVFAVMSPVAYQFFDLQQSSRWYFTSLNPAAHFLAAYYNVFWFDLMPSLKVLPFVLVFSVAATVVLARAANTKAARAARLQEEAIVLGDWSNVSGVSGRSMLYFHFALGGIPMTSWPRCYEQICAIGSLRDILLRPVSTYSKMNRILLDAVLISCVAGERRQGVALPEDENGEHARQRVHTVLEALQPIVHADLVLKRDAGRGGLA